MSTSLDIRAILIGAAALIVGYFVCFISALALTHAGPAPGWTFALMLAVAIFVSALSGFIGALFAPAKPIVHGTIGPAVGAGVLLSFTALGVSALHEPLGLSYVWPRHGL